MSDTYSMDAPRKRSGMGWLDFGPEDRVWMKLPKPATDHSWWIGADRETLNAKAIEYFPRTRDVIPSIGIEYLFMAKHGLKPS